MNTDKIGFRWLTKNFALLCWDEISLSNRRVNRCFQKSFHPCSLDESSLGTGRVNPYAAGD